MLDILFLLFIKSEYSKFDSSKIESQTRIGNYGISWNGFAYVLNKSRY